jgi:hypothetical protein
LTIGDGKLGADRPYRLRIDDRRVAHTLIFTRVAQILLCMSAPQLWQCDLSRPQDGAYIDFYVCASLAGGGEIAQTYRTMFAPRGVVWHTRGATQQPSASLKKAGMTRQTCD